MQPTQTNNESEHIQNSPDERTQKIDSEIKLKKQKLVEGLENSQEDDYRRRRPKFPRSQTENLESHNQKKENQRFAPFLLKTLQIEGETGFTPFYNEKHNLIMICPRSNPLKLYDATTFLPLEGRETLQLDGRALGVSFSSETDTFLFICIPPDLYAYDFLNKTVRNVKNIPKYSEPFSLTSATFIHSSYYAFATYSERELFVGDEKDGNLFNLGCGKTYTSCLQKLEKRNLLVSTLADGGVRIYRTDRLPKLPAVCSVQSYQKGGCLTEIEKVMAKSKYSIITATVASGIIRVWHLVKGKIRLLKVINTGELMISSFVYLEKYKMIATTHDKESIKFWSLLSGELKHTFSLEKTQIRSMFLMKDKNALGVADWDRGAIKIIQLHCFEK